GERDASISFNGDVVVIVNPAKVVEFEMSRQGRGFRCDAFHHAAVAADGIDVVVENVETRFVVPIGEPFPRNGHADTGGDALTKRSSSGFHTRNPMVFGVAGRLAIELAEVTDVVE